MDRALVVGATGYTGRFVVQALTARGVEAVAHVRPDSSRLDHWKGVFGGMGAVVDTTAWAPEAMADMLGQRRPDAIFALLGTTRKRAKGEGRTGPAGYEAVDYGLTKLLLDATVQAGIGARFVYLSSLGVTPETRNPYLAVRARLESELQASGLPHVIARPSFISGPDRDESRPGERIGAVIGDGLLGVIGALGGASIRDRYGSMDGETLAAGLVALAASGADGTHEADAIRRAARDSASPQG